MHASKVEVFSLLVVESSILGYGSLVFFGLLVSYLGCVSFPWLIVLLSYLNEMITQLTTHTISAKPNFQICY
jgi:hypothetical protein